MENGKKEEKIETVTEEKTITTFKNEKGELIENKVDHNNKFDIPKATVFLPEKNKENDKNDKKRFDIFSMSSEEERGSILTRIKEDSREDDEITEDNRNNNNFKDFSPFPSPMNFRGPMKKKQSVGDITQKILFKRKRRKMRF